MKLARYPDVWCEECNSRRGLIGVSWEVDLGGYTRHFDLCYDCLTEAYDMAVKAKHGVVPGDRPLT